MLRVSLLWLSLLWVSVLRGVSLRDEPAAIGNVRRMTSSVEPERQPRGQDSPKSASNGAAVGGVSADHASPDSPIAALNPRVKVPFIKKLRWRRGDESQATDDAAGKKKPGRHDPGADALRNGIHILTSVILIVAVGASVQLPLWVAVTNLGLSAGFAFLYFFGASLYEIWGDRQRLVWVAGLTIVWIALTPIAPVGIYLVFPLFFLYLRVMPDNRGVVAVIAATIASVLVQVPKGITFGGVMGPAVSAVVVVAIDYAFRTLSKVNKEREELIEQLMATREELAETQHNAGMVAERQRIAHEIHDTLAQGLSSIQMLLHVAEAEIQGTGLSEEEKERPLDRIRLARSTAADNLAEARAMIAALQPASLKETSLGAALQRIAESFSATGGFPVTVEVHGDGERLPMGVEAALLRIAQGAVSNVVKHADASHCEIVLNYAGDEVLLDVADDGKGFDPEELEERPAGLGHIGLDAMRRRAAEHDGQVTVESAPGEGTCVSVIMPVHPNE